MLHSSLKRTLARIEELGYHITPQDVLESFLDALGSEGTLFLPLFNFDFTKGVPFDIRHSPSQMGALTEAGRHYPGAIRTGHPIYSFAVIGKHAQEFSKVNNFSGYGGDSPFKILRDMGGKIAVLDLMDQNSMTFYHHIEEMHEVPYRYHKEFTGDYTDWHGTKTSRTYCLFVRNLEMGVLTHVNPMGELLWENGLYSGCRPKVETGLRVISSKDMYSFVSKYIEGNQAHGLLYILEGEN
jgi:aminoglycoside 3-N-acetyltransferase